MKGQADGATPGSESAPPCSNRRASEWTAGAFTISANKLLAAVWAELCVKRTECRSAKRCRQATRQSVIIIAFALATLATNRLTIAEQLTLNSEIQRAGGQGLCGEIIGPITLKPAIISRNTFEIHRIGKVKVFIEKNLENSGLRAIT